MGLEELLSRFAAALGVGLLIGLERGWRQRSDAPGTRTAGIRTFALTGVLGGTIGAISTDAGGPASVPGAVLMGLSFASFAVVFGYFCHEENRAEKTFSATTAVAGMVTFALGVYALIGDLRVTAAAAVVVAAILASREPLHGWIAGITWLELRAGLLLLAMTFVALPLLPAEPVGPFGGVNLRGVWLIAIALAGVSFLGYAAVKYFGATHGVLLAAAAGGLVSSTAVMLNNARQAAAGKSAPRLLAAGALLATAISLARVLALVVALNAALVPLLAGPLLAGAATMTAMALLLALRGADDETAGGAVPFRNPFELKSVVGFALFLGLIVVVGRVLSQQFGAAGAIVAALATGLADVDAVTVSISELPPETLSPAHAALAILAAVASNTFAKLAMGMAIGRGAFAMWILAATALGTAAAVIVWAIAARLAGG